MVSLRPLLPCAHCKVSHILKTLVNSDLGLRFGWNTLDSSCDFYTFTAVAAKLIGLYVTHSTLQVVSFVIQLKEELLSVHLLAFGSFLLGLSIFNERLVSSGDLILFVLFVENSQDALFLAHNLFKIYNILLHFQD